MIAALVYLQVHSIKNRLWMRLRRLKKPKYLAGAIVGGLYFYFYFYRWLFLGGGGAQKISGAASAETMALYESIGSVALFVIVLLSWILPRERAALAFTEAEVAFLFPAPVSRRNLIHYKLLRSQLAVHWWGNSVKEKSLNTNVIVEIFEVTDGQCCAAHMRM